MANIPGNFDVNYEMLCEAMEQLDDAYYNLGMFQQQYYLQLKKRFEQQVATNPELKKVFNATAAQQSL